MKSLLLLSAAALASLALRSPSTPPLKLNQIQVIGSHNSYKRAIDPQLYKALQKVDSANLSKIDYEHPSLTAQLDQGLGALEIDVYADTKGGQYAHPKGLAMVPGQPAYNADGAMNQPGFKVLHIQDIDFRSNCPQFRQCLLELKQWSATHPGHRPVFITMNAKGERTEQPGRTAAEVFTPTAFDALDREILDYLGADRVLTPDQVRGRYPTLESAVLARAWPTLAAAGGKFVFVLDEVGEKRASYLQGHASLKGRVLFTNSEPGTPEAAIHIVNDAKKDLAAIKSLVEKGYLIRTRADSDTREARANDRSSFEAAEQSGAQIISTDYYLPSTHFASPYVVSFPGGTYFRPNPVLVGH